MCCLQHSRLQLSETARVCHSCRHQASHSHCTLHPRLQHSETARVCRSCRHQAFHSHCTLHSRLQPSETARVCRSCRHQLRILGPMARGGARGAQLRAATVCARGHTPGSVATLNLNRAWSLGPPAGAPRNGWDRSVEVTPGRPILEPSSPRWRAWSVLCETLLSFTYVLNAVFPLSVQLCSFSRFRTLPGKVRPAF